MEILLLLLIRLTPFYLSILFGFLSARYLQVSRESVGNLLLYVVTPVIIFNAVLNTSLSYQTFLLPVFFFVCASSICVFFYWQGKRFWQGSTRNIVAYAAGSANTGYFGLPIALALWGNGAFNVVVLCMLGFIVYDCTIGFFVVARNEYDNKKALKKLLGLPSLYAIVTALILNVLQVTDLGATYQGFIANFQGAFAVFGPMLIGIALGTREKYQFEANAFIVSFVTKFVVWPLLVSAFIFIDISYLHLYSHQIHKILFLLSLVPFAANTVALATTFKAEPAKMSFIVMLSVLFASVYIPFMLFLFGQF